MPIRDIVVTLMVFGSLPLAVASPWIGVLAWSWIAYMNPHRLSWGFATSMPFAMLIAMATVVGLILTRDRKPIPRTPEIILLLLFWLHTLVTTVFALYPGQAWDQFTKFSKILVMTFVTLLVMQDRERLRWLFWVIGLSLGFFGLKGGIWAVMTGAGNHVLGPPGTFISGNTEIGLALNMVLPLLILVRRDCAQPWLRLGYLGAIVFTVVAIVSTYSRGALLGLGAVLAVLFLKSRAKALVLAGVFVGLLAATLLPDQWFERMATIQTYEKDRSAMNRLQSWELSYLIAWDHPLTGLGFRPFSRQVYRSYFPDLPARAADAHSIFFQVLAEHGFVGLGLYVSIMVACLISLRRVIRRTRGQPERRWEYDAAHMVEASMIAFIVNGAFLSLSYFDLFYHLVALTALLRVLSREPVPAAAPAAPPVPPRRRLPGRPGLARR